MDPINVQSADRCRQILNDSLVDFYLPHCIDNQAGGYFEVLDDAGDFAASDKFLTLQARHVWFFSALARANIRQPDSLQAAQHGYEFLLQHFLDADRGGYIAKTNRQGQPVDDRKHVYPNAFVIYALVEYHRASGNPQPLEQAMQLFAELDEHCYDRKFGGYNELFNRDWTLATDASQPTYIGALNTKTYNSHLHLLEAFAQLFRETRNPLVGQRLHELIHINTLTVKHPEWPCNIDGWHPDWTIIDSPRNLRASYGHDVECIWLVLDAAQALELPTRPLLGWARRTGDYSLTYGYDQQHGGFFYTGPLGQPSDDRKKVWWTQTEAMVAMLTLHQLTGDPVYRQRFDETLDFVEQHHLAEQGGWWANLNPDGSLGTDRVRTSMWQGGYHNARALLRCEQLLRQP